ncbi:MAG: SUMF1/EgtB/PvdO family nonheme iron enzyme [Rhodanobacteraceae bacterium]|nr:SUMF1/EgtB/PvdO family nonheme iron enzyme [Rhodanobacteraceae bacterium]
MTANPGIPFEIPGYRIVRQLGQGGMATVYLAVQNALDREVAIKVLGADRAPSEDLIKRFENEARVIAKLDHPHIVSIYEVGRASSGHLYYTLPYLPNGDLSKRKDSGDQERIVGILRNLAHALGHAHRHGIVHRDVKPENVLFDKLDRPQLADFGIALVRHSDVRVTREGATLGSTGYMSPEQARGQVLDGRSDLYSLGVMAYELLTGDLPFHGPDALSVALAHVEQPAPRLPPQRKHWQPVMDKLLAKDPAQRYATADELLTDLDAVERELRHRQEAPVVTTWRERVSEWPASIWVGVVAIAGTLVLLAMLLWPKGGQSPDARFVTVPPLVETTIPAATETPVTTTESPEAAAAAAAARLGGLLDKGARQLSEGKVVAPAGDNAAESYLAALVLEPANTTAGEGMSKVFVTLGANFDQALQAGDSAGMRSLYEQARLVADRAQLRDSPAWTGFLAGRQSTFEQRLHAAQQAGLAEQLAALKPAAEVLAQDQANLLTRWQAAERELSSRTRQRSELEPDLVFVPAELDGKQLDHAFELGRTEVTRAEYARFVRATGRAAARCREPLRPLSRLKSLEWRDPDFAQDEDEPVVCVSWKDANAYARWLSNETGANYRLPTEAEWLHAAASLTRGASCEQGNVADASMGMRWTLASRHKCSDGRAHTSPVGRYRASSLGAYDLAGNASEWTSACDAKDCSERVFRGTSWRDGPDETATSRRGSSDVDTGYTTIGFRLVRELGAVAAAKATP